MVKVVVMVVVLVVMVEILVVLGKDGSSDGSIGTGESGLWRH